MTEQPHPSPARASGGEPITLASDADRDRAAGLLNTAFAEGRLTADEHGERVRAAYAARTWQQLRQLTGDLPTLDSAVARQAAAPGEFAGLDRCLLCALLIACPPAGIAWLFLSRRRSRAYPGQPLAEAGAPPPGIGAATPPPVHAHTGAYGGEDQAASSLAVDTRPMTAN